MFRKAIEMLNGPNPDQRVVRTLIEKAAELNYSRARAHLARMKVFGQNMDFDFEYAAREFDELSKEGLSIAHMVCIIYNTFSKTYYLHFL